MNLCHRTKEARHGTGADEGASSEKRNVLRHRFLHDGGCSDPCRITITQQLNCDQHSLGHKVFYFGFGETHRSAESSRKRCCGRLWGTQLLMGTRSQHTCNAERARTRRHSLRFCLCRRAHAIHTMACEHGLPNIQVVFPLTLVAPPVQYAFLPSKSIWSNSARPRDYRRRRCPVATGTADSFINKTSKNRMYRSVLARKTHPFR